MKKLMMVGGFGFIGKNIIEILNNKYQIIVVDKTPDSNFIDKDLVKYYEYDFGVHAHIKEILDNEAPDFIVNLVSVVTANRDLKLFKDMIDSNVRILLELYEASRYNANLKLFINFGSLEEYGNIQPPFRETDREYPNSPYSLAKQLTTNTAIMLCANYNFPIMVLRLGNVFGKYQNEDKFIPYIIKKLMQDANIDTTWGEQKRDFIYADDFVYILDKILENYDLFIGEIVNVSYGTSFSLKEIIEFCKKETNSLSYVDYGKLPYRENEAMDFRCDINKLREKVEFDFHFDLFEALKDYIKSVREGIR